MPEVARYLGYDGSAGYQVVDLTEDCDESREFPPPLGRHPVPRTWAEADFRIAFAKNKTHAYAYYTLTLKDIYGALPLANKFKEYHCDRGIDGTTIEYLAAFPVHYGLIDAHLSADGPFGIFADPAPNVTHTMIGGADLVAVDWIGASKMGIDPMISSYMRLAVERFGKPEIELVEGSDASPYRPWLNVPVALTLFTTKGLDANYYVGNLFYTSGAQMDESYFTYKDRAWYLLFLRRLTLPVRRALFLRTGREPHRAQPARQLAVLPAGVVRSASPAPRKEVPRCPTSVGSASPTCTWVNETACSATSSPAPWTWIPSPPVRPWRRSSPACARSSRTRTRSRPSSCTVTSSSSRPRPPAGRSWCSSASWSSPSSGRMGRTPSSTRWCTCPATTTTTSG